MHRGGVTARQTARILCFTLAAGACSSSKLDSGGPACPTPVGALEAPFVRCSQPDSSTSSFDADVTVLGWDSGLVGCLSVLMQDSSHLAPVARLLRVRTAAGEEQGFGLVLPGLTPAIQAGDMVHLLYESEPGFFSPNYSRLELRNAAGLVLYVGLGGRPDRMKTPAEVQLGVGKQLCSTFDCGPWGMYELDVTMQGMTRSFAPNTSARVGPYLVVVGASEQQTGGSDTCFDWFVSRTEIGVAP
jgi:hypothetical protein